MKTIQKIYNSIEQFFFKENTEGSFLVFFRVAVGLVTLLHFLAVIFDFNTLFSSKSIVPQDIMTVFHPNWLLTFPKIVNWGIALGMDEIQILTITKYSYISLCILIMLGFYSRIAAFCLLFLQVALLKGSSFFIYGADFFTSMSLFYIILFPSDNYYSLRNYLWKRPDMVVNITPIKRLFQVHISIAYFFSGFDKLLGFNWHNGESIWKTINLPYSNHDFFFQFSWLANHSYLLVIIGWATIIVEMMYPLFVWIPQTRRFWLMSTIMLHIGIALVLNLYFFSAIMIVWNLTNFYYEKASSYSYKFKFNLNYYKYVLE